jgi:2-haloacid dehalogenase
MKYKFLIFDADHTLLNYIQDELAAFQTLYQEIGLPITQELMQKSRNYSEEEWMKAGLYNVNDIHTQKHYHTLYRTHVNGIFKRIFSELGYTGNEEKAGARFLKLLERESVLMSGAEETLKALQKKARIFIATNGVSSIQNGRLRRIQGLFEKAYISEEIGKIKPLSGFFERILTDLNAKREECLMIGDSLSSDIAGAKKAGIDACWVNVHSQTNDTGIVPDYEIHSLIELLDIL